MFTSGDPSFAQYNVTLFFLSTANQTVQQIYGFYVVQASAGILMWAERFTTGPFSIVLNGDDIQITLKLAAE